MALELKQGHNQAAYLVKDKKWAQYDKVIDLIVNSGYHTAFTIDPPIHVHLLQEFWANAEVITVDGEPVSIASNIGKTVIGISPEVLAIRLGIQDKDAPTAFKTGEVHTTLTECGYQGDLSHTTIYKNFLIARTSFYFTI